MGEKLLRRRWKKGVPCIHICCRNSKSISNTMVSDRTFRRERLKRSYKVSLCEYEVFLVFVSVCESFTKIVNFIFIGDNDIYVSMPTGSGKSLIYQLPAVLKDKQFAIVFCPLLALLQVAILLNSKLFNIFNISVP